MSIEQTLKDIDLKLASKELTTTEAQRQIELAMKNITSWERVQLSRHPQRPYTLDYIAEATTDFVELHGDRKFGDDPAIVGGLATMKNGRKLMIIGHQKGKNTKEKLLRNFGMARPEGYRKALRLMKLAERWQIPVVTLVDTPGAYPGIEGEQRGQSEAIADNLLEMSQLKTPIVSIIIGEGGSGGALALAVSDRVFMLEYSIYSVISPESCASILWSDVSKAATAAEQLKITSDDLSKLPGIIHGVISEPAGGAQRDYALISQNLFTQVEKSLQELEALSVEDLIASRRQYLRQLGNFAIEQGN